RHCCRGVARNDCVDVFQPICGLPERLWELDTAAAGVLVDDQKSPVREHVAGVRYMQRGEHHPGVARPCDRLRMLRLCPLTVVREIASAARASAVRWAKRAMLASIASADFVQTNGFGSA